MGTGWVSVYPYTLFKKSPPPPEGRLSDRLTVLTEANGGHCMHVTDNKHGKRQESEQRQARNRYNRLQTIRQDGHKRPQETTRGDKSIYLYIIDPARPQGRHGRTTTILHYHYI